MEGIRRALIICLVLIAGTAIEQAPSVGTLLSSLPVVSSVLNINKCIVISHILIQYNMNQLSSHFIRQVFISSIPFIKLLSVHDIQLCCIFRFSKYTHCVCWWKQAISAGGLLSACQFQYCPRKLTRAKLMIKHIVYNSSHLRMWLSEALMTSSACPENTTNCTRSK